VCVCVCVWEGVWCGVCVWVDVCFCVLHIYIRIKKNLSQKFEKKKFHDLQFLFCKILACNISSFPLSNCHNNIAQNIDLSQITVL